MVNMFDDGNLTSPLGAWGGCKSMVINKTYLPPPEVKLISILSTALSGRKLFFAIFYPSVAPGYIM